MKWWIFSLKSLLDLLSVLYIYINSFFGVRPYACQTGSLTFAVIHLVFSLSMQPKRQFSNIFFFYWVKYNNKVKIELSNYSKNKKLSAL